MKGYRFDDCYAIDKNFVFQTQSNYENRIRKFSDPLRTFNYFASIKIKNTTCMSVKDLVRSLTRNASDKEVQSGSDNGILAKIHQGKPDVHFFEYMFYRLILNISARNLELLFDLIDLDSNGELSIDEFMQFILLLLRSENASNALIKYQLKQFELKVILEIKIY